jgi:hypothetical protein
MNTNDIRNMDQNQWLYWVVALPVTVIVVLLCLVLAGILQVSSPFDEDQEESSSIGSAPPAYENYWREDHVSKPLFVSKPERPLDSYVVVRSNRATKERTGQLEMI